MKNIFVFTTAIFVIILSACKKDNTLNTVDSRISAHFLFKTGTWWVYYSGQSINDVLDSMYVAATGFRNGYPYMQINEVIRGELTDTIYSSFTTYIGAGPTATQMQQWDYDILNHTSASQVIFDMDTPNYAGVRVAENCIYGGTGNIGGGFMPGINLSNVFSYAINYTEPNPNQYYGSTGLYYYPDQGIILKYEYNTPLTPTGEVVTWTLARSYIIQ